MRSKQAEPSTFTGEREREDGIGVTVAITVPDALLGPAEVDWSKPGALLDLVSARQAFTYSVGKAISAAVDQARTAAGVAWAERNPRQPDVPGAVWPSEQTTNLPTPGVTL